MHFIFSTGLGRLPRRALCVNVSGDRVDEEPYKTDRPRCVWPLEEQVHGQGLSGERLPRHQNLRPQVFGTRTRRGAQAHLLR